MLITLFCPTILTIKDSLVNWIVCLSTSDNYEKEIYINRLLAYKLYLQSMSCTNHWTKLVDKKLVLVGENQKECFEDYIFMNYKDSLIEQLITVLFKVSKGEINLSNVFDDELKEIHNCFSVIKFRMPINTLSRFFLFDKNLRRTLNEEKELIVKIFEKLRLDKYYAPIKEYCLKFDTVKDEKKEKEKKEVERKDNEEYSVPVKKLKTS